MLAALLNKLLSIMLNGNIKICETAGMGLLRNVR